MGSCGIPTFTCVLLLLVMAALYASASSRDDDAVSNYVMQADDVMQSYDASSNMHVRMARSAQHSNMGSTRVNVNNRGNPGRIADSGDFFNNDETSDDGNDITSLGHRRRGGRPNRRERPRRPNGGRRRRPRPGQNDRLPAGVNRRMMRLAEKVYNASSPFAASLFTSVFPQITRDTVMSPLSIHTALTMTMLGARRRTERELSSVLGLREVRLRNMKAHQAYHGLLASLDNVHQDVNIHLANAVFVKPNIPLEDSFRQGLNQMYGASFENFELTHPSGPETPINAWVANATRDRIQNLLAPGTITPLTAMILINAIYFNATWSKPFNARLTKQEDFQSLSRGVKRMDMMLDTGFYQYANHYNTEVIEIPYRGDRLAMYIMLPNQASNINQLLQELTDTERNGLNPLEHMFEGLTPTSLKLILPKFRVDSGLLDLKAALQNMGIRRAFDEDKADFSGISAAELHIDDVLHKAFIDVNESGTEAAAATAVIFGVRSSSPYYVTPQLVKVDRPFMFAIRDKTMKVVLFMGAYVGHSD